MALIPENLFTRQIYRKDDTQLTIYQAEVGDVGCVVWDAALVLSAYLENCCGGQFCNIIDRADVPEYPKVIELGAGTGVVGIVAAALGADVIITDLEEFVPLIDKNIGENIHTLKGKAIAKTLKWGEDVSQFVDPYPEVILMSDCVYYEQSLEPLLKTMKELSGEHTIILCCYEERSTTENQDVQQKFLQMVEKDFVTEEVPHRELDPHFQSDDIHLLRFFRR